VALDLLGFGIVIPLLPLYAERFDAGSFVIGALFASYSLAQLVFSPLWGRVSDRVGRRPVLLVTIAGSAIGSLILGLAGTITMLFIGRIVDGISGASVAVARATVADVAAPKDRARLMGLLGAAFGVGFVLGPSIGALATLISPSTPFLLAAALSFGNLVLAWARLPETRKPTADSTPPRDSGIRSLNAPIIRLVVVGFGAITAFAAFEATFALLATSRFGASDSTVAWIFAGVGVLLVAAQGGIIGPLSTRIGDTNVIRFGQVLDLVGFVVIATASAWSALAAGIAFLAMGQGLLTPALSSAVAAESGADDAGLALGVQQAAGGLGRVIGPLVGGALFAIDTPFPYVAAAALSLIVLPLTPRNSG
jgi:multidrug resistance protein